MASISRQPNGRKILQFISVDGTRKTIRLGKRSLREAQKIKLHVEDLVRAVCITGHVLEPETIRWLASLDGTLREKLADVGLIASEKLLLQPFIDSYIAKRAGKSSTKRKWRNARDHLIEYFGAEKPINEITRGHADEWNWWFAERRAENTVHRLCGIAKQFFDAAVRKELIRYNPFADLTTTVEGNSDREFFVSREDSNAILEACPDAQWRLIFALSRYGGLRTPSEHLSLRWADIDWERERMLVRSPKTERHKGHESRWVPLFPELLPYLEECFDLAEEKTVAVITAHIEGLKRDDQTLRFDPEAANRINARWHKQFLTIIDKAKLPPWPKLFQNLRSTRQTELEEHFQRAVTQGLSQQPGPQRAAKSAAVSAGNARKGPQAESGAHEKTPVLQGFTDSDEALPRSENCPMGDTGLKPVTSRM